MSCMLRDERQAGDILKEGHGRPGKLEVLTQGLSAVQGVEGATRVLTKMKPDSMFFTAGKLAGAPVRYKTTQF